MKSLPSLLLASAAFLCPAAAQAVPEVPKALPVPSADPFKKPDAPPAPKPDAAPSEQEPAAGPIQVLLQIEVFTLARAEAHALLLSGLNDTDLHAELTKKLTDKTATLDEFTLLRTRSGQRAKVQEIDEFPYPTDFDPPQTPQTLALIDAPALSALQALLPGVAPTPPKPQPAATEPAPKGPGHHPNGGMGLQTTTTPTTFTFRDLGSTLEVDPVIGEDGKTVDLTVAPKTTRFIGYRDHGGSRHPMFQSQAVNTSVTTTSGTPVLISNCSQASNLALPTSYQGDAISLEFVTPYITGLPAATKQPVEEAAPRCFRTQFEIISLPKEAAHRLMTQHLADAQTHGQLVEGIKAGTARLETLTTVKTKSGQRAKVEELIEFPYPTEFDPPQIPQTLIMADQASLDLLHGPGAGPGLRPADGTIDPSNGGFGIITTTTSTAFQVRNTGTSLEIDPVFGEDGITVDLTVEPEVVRFVKMIQYQSCDQPIFETQKLNTAVTARINVPVLLGTMNKPLNTGVAEGNAEDRIWLAFVTVFDH